MKTCISYGFLFNDPATTEIYTLSLHDALPISAAQRARDGCRRHEPAVQRRRAPDLARARRAARRPCGVARRAGRARLADLGDRKSTRLNSSHANISYAVFCLKKKKQDYTSYLS